jgi:hypothetical protein
VVRVDGLNFFITHLFEDALLEITAFDGKILILLEKDNYNGAVEISENEMKDFLILE